MFACMGIDVDLAVIEERISEATWREIYEKARRVAKQWAPRPLALGWRQIGAVRVVPYTLDIETAEGLHIVGDADTLTAAEIEAADLDELAFRSSLPRAKQLAQA